MSDKTFKKLTALVTFDGEEQGNCSQKATATSLLPSQTTLDLNLREPIASRRIQFDQQDLRDISCQTGTSDNTCNIHAQRTISF